MNFIEAVSLCFKKYATFDGTASRSEYWWFFLFVIVGNFVLGQMSSFLSFAFAIATLVPSIAVACRRLHDTDRSGWMQLIWLIPLVGWIILIVFLAQESRPNRYGVPAGAVV
ncbi:DUF805 domain-containing protein [Massilia sp. Dwa41.01b]|uniref:DUF805 domain-containing protein n=1 Tax=unclassified Massilia TaxID=2609279 RepID=UPI0015FEC82E|nr:MULTISPECIES: DUF805 domain-containing protein [unclassified Massilia]QNA89915.1 DUF805 domain-containing protein [Massilia sp. Dwa41.01b]QNB00800.1 DUF805 domain-containing protein [Massilia sp. Se16.2.3]